MHGMDIVSGAEATRSPGTSSLQCAACRNRAWRYGLDASAAPVNVKDAYIPVNTHFASG